MSKPERHYFVVAVQYDNERWTWFMEPQGPGPYGECLYDRENDAWLAYFGDSESQNKQVTAQAQVRDHGFVQRLMKMLGKLNDEEIQTQLEARRGSNV